MLVETNPIHNIITNANKNKKKNLTWNENARKKFASKILLNHFNRGAKLSLTVDALNVAVDAILQ